MVGALRSFVDVGTEPGAMRRVMHAINVGSPQRLHYTLDYDQGTIVQIWRGDFLDATPMWHARGDGSARPRGSVEFMTLRPLSAILTDRVQDWPAPYAGLDFHPLRYRVESNGLPVFHYRLGDITIEDAILPVAGKWLERRLTFNKPAQGLHVLLADAGSLEDVKRNWYAVDDRRYYIRVRDAGRVFIRKADARSQVLATPVNGHALAYDIVF